MDPHPVLSGDLPWRADTAFRLLIVQRGQRGRFRHLIPLWARLPGWSVVTVDRSSLSGVHCSESRPHAVLVDDGPVAAAACLRLFPSARQVLHIDESFDPVAAAGFDAVTCAYWWQRACMPDALQQHVRVMHPGMPPVRPVERSGLHTLDGRWLVRADRALAIAVDGWPTGDGEASLSRLLPALLERLCRPVLLIVPPNAPPRWKAFAADERVHCIEDPGHGRRAPVFQMSALFLCGARQADWLLSAMVAGCPVLASASEVTRELIRHPVSGWLHGEGRGMPALADAAVALLSDDAQRARLAREAQADARRDFDLDAAAARYARLLMARPEDDGLLPLPAWPFAETLRPAVHRANRAISTCRPA